MKEADEDACCVDAAAGAAQTTVQGGCRASCWAERGVPFRAEDPVVQQYIELAGLMAADPATGFRACGHFAYVVCRKQMVFFPN